MRAVLQLIFYSKWTVFTASLFVTATPRSVSPIKESQIDSLQPELETILSKTHAADV